MKVGTKEFYDILSQFEKNYYHMRLDKEPADAWAKGTIYQNGETNNIYQAYMLGYSLGRVVYMND